MINIPKELIKDHLVARLKRTFDGKPWYGKSIMSILSMSEQDLSPNTLSLLNHMVAWQDFVTAALEGHEIKIELNTEQDWPSNVKSETMIRAKLLESHNQLIKSIENFDLGRWHEQLKDAKYDYYQLCMGLIDHNIYHLGQIAKDIKS